MGFAINWQQQSNTWINLTYTPFTCLTVVPLTMPLLSLCGMKSDLSRNLYDESSD